MSTFPKRFEGLRDRLFERAKVTPEFLETVFTLNHDGVPSEDEIIQSVENRLFTIIKTYPWWFCGTPGADAQATANRRRYLIERGIIQPNAVPAGIAKYRQEQLANVYEAADDRATADQEA